jgi:gliding motility-associated-like protein
MISNTNIANPLVSPDVPTTYYVRLTDSFGCFQDDSVRIDVRTTVSVRAGADTTICRTDAIVLNPVSDALYYQWTPATYLDFDNIKNPVATPLTNITYTVVGSIGKCVGQDDITITVVPYPVANAGADISICSGFSTQLNASGGSSYVWSPATFLSDRFIANPVVSNPTASIQYIVNVRDNLGCQKPVKDTVWVYVATPVIADAGPRDTTVVLDQPLYLHATGGDSYSWSLPTWLNNPTIQDPVALPQDDIRYTVTATTAQGCIGTDFINVKLYKMDPDLYVPTGFSPNGDGNNDILKPILLGMRDLHYFKIFNRNGQLIFSTTIKNDGWDGTFKGKAQEAATYVWMAEGINYKGELRKKKGTSILIR